MNRRGFLGYCAATGAAWATSQQGSARALTPVEVAYAGSMGAMMNGGVAPAVAQSLGLALRGRGQGAFGLARLIIAGSIRPDLFVSVTPGPVQLLLSAGLARQGIPIARTEMVLAYSPEGALAAPLARGAGPWWRLLEQPGIRFGRTDPLTDPQGVNVILMMRLAARYYHEPRLAERVLGPLLNRAQIFPEPEVMARLQAGQLDAASAYKTQPAALGLPFLDLPPQINLGDARLAAQYAQVGVRVAGHLHRPSPLVFYAVVLRHASRPRAAEQLVAWFGSPEGQLVLARFHYDPAPGAPVLRPGTASSSRISG